VVTGCQNVSPAPKGFLRLFAGCVYLVKGLAVGNFRQCPEPYLTGLIMAAVYYFSRAHRTNTGGPLLAGAGFTACALMTKGLVALIPIGGALAGELVLTKQWHDLWHIRWVGAALLILVGITPALYCLYAQCAAHPDQVVFGRTRARGV